MLKNHGFLIIELLISIVFFVAFSLGVWSFYTLVIKTENLASIRTQELDLALQAMENLKEGDKFVKNFKSCNKNFEIKAENLATDLNDLKVTKVTIKTCLLGKDVSLSLIKGW